MAVTLVRINPIEQPQYQMSDYNQYVPQNIKNRMSLIPIQSFIRNFVLNRNHSELNFLIIKFLFI